MNRANELMQQAIHLDDWALISRELAKSGTGIKIKSSLTVRDFMRPNPWVLTVDDTLKSVGDIIINKNIDGVPIIDQQGALVGLVSKSLLLKEMLNGSPAQTPVRNFMISAPISVGPDENVSVLITVNIGNLPVVENGRLIGIVTLSDTIRAYFSALMAVREELNTVLDAAHNGIITVDESGRIVIVNTAAKQWLGIKREEIIGQYMGNFFVDNEIMEVLHSGRPVLGKKMSYGQRVVISNQTPIISNDEIIGAVAIFQDISSLEAISQELSYTKRMKEELDAIIESSFDGIHVSDGNGLSLRVNESFTRIMGVTRGEVLGKSESELLEQGVYTQPVVDRVLSSGETITIAQESKSGGHVIITAGPVRGPEGQIFRVVANCHDMTELNLLKSELEQAQNLGLHYQEKLNKYQFSDQYVMHSKKSQDLLDLCIRLGQVDTTVLIQGESGVGKEIAAEIIHASSTRSERPMISINCAAIPENLLESELFGYESGAFTGASKSGKPGIFETASGGTLFLDEVGELPLGLQGKLLRAIQQREITRLGGTVPVAIDVRLLAATNRDLWEMVDRKEFRKDLYYRLNVVPVQVAPLRDRKAEIPFFISHFLKVFNQKYHLHKRLDEASINRLLAYDWPGNVRELENLIERLVVTHPENVIRIGDLPELHSAFSPAAPGDSGTNMPAAAYAPIGTADLKRAVEELEKQLIENALASYGSTRRVAAALGVSQPTVVRKAARYGITLRY